MFRSIRKEKGGKINFPDEFDNLQTLKNKTRFAVQQFCHFSFLTVSSIARRIRCQFFFLCFWRGEHEIFPVNIYKFSLSLLVRRLEPMWCVVFGEFKFILSAPKVRIHKKYCEVLTLIKYGIFSCYFRKSSLKSKVYKETEIMNC